MYFHKWLKRKAKAGKHPYVHRDEVLEYLKGKDSPTALQIISECEDEPEIKIIPIAVWEDEYYNFKG